jgi:acetyl esterase/lipase
MKKFLVWIILIMPLATFGQEPLVMKLWADGAPNSNGLTGEERMLENGRVSNVTVPTLTVYPAKNGNGMAVISCPGGGYTHLAMNHEGYDMAAWFNEQGITYAVLKYRMPNGHFDAPLSDVQQAIRLMRRHADEWKFDADKLGIMGASAGGHLASTAATHFTSSEDRPDFQILLYPLIILNERFAKGMFGEHPSDEMIKKYTSDLQVTDKTPQAIIFCSTDDRTVTPEHGIRYYTALIDHGVSASIHIYPTGMHGWGYKDSFTYKRQWTGELEKWLREINKSLNK